MVANSLGLRLPPKVDGGWLPAGVTAQQQQQQQQRDWGEVQHRGLERGTGTGRWTGGGGE